MSSHHVVRDEQEPALLLLNATAAPYQTVQGLLEWSPTVIVSQPALTEALKWAIKIDLAVTPVGTEKVVIEQLQHQAPVQVLTCGNNHPETVLQTAAYYLTARNYDSLNVIGQPLPALRQQMHDLAGRLNTVLYYNNHKQYLLKAEFEKWADTNSLFAVEAINTPTTVTQPVAQGPELVLAPGQRHEWHLQQEGFFKVKCSAPCWLTESHASNQ